MSQYTYIWSDKHITIFLIISKIVFRHDSLLSEYEVNDYHINKLQAAETIECLIDPLNAKSRRISKIRLLSMIFQAVAWNYMMNVNIRIHRWSKYDSFDLFHYNIHDVDDIGTSVSSVSIHITSSIYYNVRRRRH